MGLDAGFNCYSGGVIVEEIYLQNHCDFTFLVNDAAVAVYGYFPEGCSIPIDEAVLDEIEDRLSPDGTFASSSIPDEFFDDEPQDWTEAISHYVAVVDQIREWLRIHDRVEHWCG